MFRNKWIIAGIVCLSLWLYGPAIEGLAQSDSQGIAQPRIATQNQTHQLYLPMIANQQQGNLSTNDSPTSTPVGDGQVQAAIVGGQAASPGEYPWQVSLHVDDQHDCGGSLIARRWVLTAGHCVEGRRPDEIVVILGAHKIKSDHESTRQIVQVNHHILHPQYESETLDNDIALLKLAEAAQLNDRVALIPLANLSEFHQYAAPGILATVSGWGRRSENGIFANALQEVSVPILPQHSCHQSYPGEISDNMFCAGYPEGGRDSCEADSGGPLIVRHGNGSWIQAGIVSWGEGCAEPGYPGVYAKLSNYVSWIEGYTGQIFNPTPTQVPPTQVPPTQVPPTQVPPTPIPTDTSPPIDTNPIYLVNVNSGKCVETAGGGTSTLTNIQQYACNNTGSQLWQQVPADGGFMLRNPESDKCLDVEGSSYADGGNVLLYTCAGNPNQILNWHGSALVFQHSGKCLDVNASSTDDGANIQQWGCNGTNAQSFSVNPTQPSATPTPSRTPVIPTQHITIRTQDGTVVPDGTIDVSIEVLVSGSNQTVSAAGMVLTYDATVLMANRCTFDGGFSGSCNTDKAGEVHISAINPTGNSSDFNLAIIGFHAVGDAGERTTLHLSVNSLGNMVGTTLTNRQIENGQITLSSLVTGDMNCSNSSDTIDALFIMQYVVGMRTDSGGCPLSDPTTQLNAAAGDVNGDGRTDTIDALFVMQCVVGIPNSLCPGVQRTSHPDAGDAGVSAPSRSVTIQTERAANRITLTTSGSDLVTAGAFEVAYDQTTASFTGCRESVVFATVVCHETQPGLIFVSYINVQDTIDNMLVDLTFEPDGHQGVHLHEVNVIDLVDRNGNPFTVDVGGQTQRIFLPLLTK